MVYRIFTICFLFFTLLFIACQEPDTGIINDSGKLILRLTDAPFPHDKISSVNVSISSIELFPSKHSAAIEPEADFLELLDKPLWVNLLELTNGITLTLSNSDIPVGSYTSLRIFLRHVEIVLADKTVYDLTPRTNKLQGKEIVLSKPFEISAGLTTDLLLDFDVSRSFVPRMSPVAQLDIAGFLFNPVILVSNTAHSGSLSGIITSSSNNKISRLHGAQVSVMQADTLVTTTFTDRAGMYTILGLQPGSYKVRAEYRDLSTSSPKSVNISADKNANQNIDLKTVNSVSH